MREHAVGHSGPGGLGARPGRQPGAVARAGALRQRPRGAPRGLRPRLRRVRVRPEPVRRGVGRDRSRSSSPRSRPSATPPWWPGCSRPPRTPHGPTTRCWCAGPAGRRTARSTSTTPSATGSPTRCAPVRSSRSWSTSARSGSGLMTCYDLRFPELARLLVDQGRRGARRPVRVGRRPAQGRPLAHAGAGARDREHRVRGRRRPARTALLGSLDGRGPPWATCWPRPARRQTVLHATLDRAVLEQARRTNPSLANRRFPPPAL